MNYSIDGLFLTQKPTGTHRYAIEILKELDVLLNHDSLDVEIVVPRWYERNLEFENIKIVRYGNLKGIPWEQIDFAFYLIKNKKKGVFLSNVFSIFAPKGIIVVHDICYKRHPEFYKSLRDRISMMWHRMNYYLAVHSKMRIVTVSFFSKSEIQEVYGFPYIDICVIYNAWQHIRRIEESETIFDKFPELKRTTGFYFSLSTLGANKNYKWIVNVARKNPSEMFAIAGRGKLKGIKKCDLENIPQNVLFLGYINDSEIKSLMHRCKGFLFPSLYEGFGLTPLEAIASGAKNVYVSDIPCMKEVYGNSVNYIDPYDYNYSLSNIPKNQIDITYILKKYSWEESAKKMLELLKN